MRCPACRTVLVVVERRKIEVDWCPECRGIWFDEGELELLGQRVGMEISPESLFEESDRQGSRRCPRCSRKLEQVAVPEIAGGAVQVDRCPSHGLWFDRGELSRLLRGRSVAHGEDESVMLDFLGETFAIGGETTSGEKR